MGGGSTNVPLDEGLQKLADFCSALASANGNLQDSTTVVETRTEESHKMEDATTELVGGLGDDLERFARELDQAETETLQALEETAQSANTAAEGRLGALEQRIEAAEDGLESRLASDGTELEQKAADLLSSGFSPLETSLDHAEAEAGRVETEIDGVYDAFESALQTLQGELETARIEAEQALADATDELQNDETQALHADASAGHAGWSDELPSNLEAEADGVASALESAYQGFGGDTIATGEELIGNVSKLGHEAGDALLNEPGAEVDMAAQAVVSGDVAMLDGEMGAYCDSADVSAGTAESLDPMIDELEKVKLVIADIDKALQAME